MTDKVQKIREEVEMVVNRRLNLLNGDYFDLNKEADGFTNEIMDIIDSLQEEPVSIWYDSCEIPESGTNILMIRKDEEDSNYPPIAGCFHGTNSRLDGKNWGYYNGFCYNEIEPPVKWAYIDDLQNLSNVRRTVKDWKEEPVSEDLEVELTSYMENSFTSVEEPDEFLTTVMQKDDLLAFARHFANWQKEQFENNRLKHCNSITNEQAELEQDFIDKHLDKYNCMPTFLDAIEYGMQLQKEQMMKYTIKCEITWMDGFMLNYTQEQQDDLLEKIGAKVGDKVKLVIIKENNK